MKVGNWVFFKTRNWPKDVHTTHIDLATGKTKNITGQGLYQGRGKIVGIAGSNQPFQAVVASIFVNVCEIVDNVLPGLRSMSFLKRVTQWYSVKFSIGLSKRVR